MIKINFKKNCKLYISLFVVFLVALLYNALSPFTTDDYSYMYSFATGERITSLFQVFPSMVTHYAEMNGRTAPHFLAQCLLIFPKAVFNIANSLMFTAFVYLIYKATSLSKEFRPLMLFVIPMFLWVNVPVFGQVFLWVMGAFNYFWGYFFGLLFMSFYLKIYRTEQELSKKSYIGLCILGFWFGGYSENGSFSIIFVSFLLLALTALQSKNWKFLAKYSVPVVFGALGYLTMLLCPSSTSKIGEFSISSLIHKVIELLTAYYTRHQGLLIIFVLLFVIATHYKIDKKERIIALAYFLISIISVAMLGMASYLADRSLGVGAVFLVIAVFQLMQAIRANSRTECIAYCIAAYFLIANVLVVWDGTYDIYDVYRQHTAREAYIEEQKAQGETIVTVPIIYPMTKYSCKYILTDLTTIEEPYAWPNPHIAKYYGLEKIYGENPW